MGGVQAWARDVMARLARSLPCDSTTYKLYQTAADIRFCLSP
jgi:hypothetical protein